MNKLIERLRRKAECEDMDRKPDPTTLTRQAIKALEAADRMAGVIEQDALHETKGKALTAYRTATQGKNDG